MTDEMITSLPRSPLPRASARAADNARVPARVAERRWRVPDDLFMGIGQGWRMAGIMKWVERRLSGDTNPDPLGSQLMNYRAQCANRAAREGDADLEARQQGKDRSFDVFVDAAECLAMARPPPGPDAPIGSAKGKRDKAENFEGKFPDYNGVIPKNLRTESGFSPIDANAELLKMNDLPGKSAFTGIPFSADGWRNLDPWQPNAAHP